MSQSGGMANDKHLQVFLDRIRDGLLRVDPDGVAWSVGHRHKTSTKVFPHAPRPYRGKDRDGYIHLYVRATYGEDGTDVHMYVHRLVYLIYTGTIPEGYVINHKNGIRDDNRVENLEVVTTVENVTHSYSVLKTPRRPKGALSREQARAIFLACADGESSADIASRFGISRASVRGIKYRRRWIRATADL